MSSNREGCDRSSCGVRVARASCTGANAETISDTGASTERSRSPWRQVVFIDSESLPTGIVMRSAVQSSLTARTVAYSSASSPGSPQAAIQFADKRMSSRRRMSAAIMLVIASATASRPEAGASSTATGARSPIAMASPLNSS